MGTSLLSSCGVYVVCKQSPLSTWHPVLGWFSVSLDSHLQAAMPLVKLQLSKLWEISTIRALTRELSTEAARLPAVPQPPSHASDSSGLLSGSSSNNLGAKYLKQAIEKTKSTLAATQDHLSTSMSREEKGLNRLGSPIATKIALTCSLYHTAVRTLSQLRIDILAGLCCGE